MSHIKNVQSFEKLLGICTGLGEQYEPGNQKLQVEAMTTLLSQARSAISVVIASKVANDYAIDEREAAFADLSKLATRVLASLKASNAAESTLENVRNIIRKMRSAKTYSSDIPADGTGEEPKRRARGLDYGSLTFQWTVLIENLQKESKYRPQLPALRLSSLQAKKESLELSNLQVMRTWIDLQSARKLRDSILYTDPYSMFEVSMLVKAHVKSMFGYNHPQARMITSIIISKEA